MTTPAADPVTSPLEYEHLRRTPPPPPRLWRVIFVPPMSMLTAWNVGAMTNAVNGSVSRIYFDEVLGWTYGGRLSIGDIVWQGIRESSVFGILFAFVVTIVYLAVTGTRGSLALVARVHLDAAPAALALWLLGGVIGLVFAACWPATFREAFPPSKIVTGEALTRWGFVGGSIWGAYAGGLAAIVAACVSLGVRWRRLIEGEQNAAAAGESSSTAAYG